MPGKPVSSAALVVYAFAVALGVGLPSAYYALRGDHPFGSVRAGPWKAWPQVGSRVADPYSRAIQVRRAEIPLAQGEGLALQALRDSGGLALDSSCAYRIGAATPQTRLWTLTLYDEAGRLQASDLVKAGLSSAEILRNADGSFAVIAAPSARPGNWLKTPTTARFSLMLRLYDTPAAAATAILDARTLPAIERLDCVA